MILNTSFICALGIVAQAWAEPVRKEFTLDNGARIVLIPVAGTGRVAMETLYDVGMIDEPEGLTQAAHLVEHLMCMGATKGEKAGEAWKRLSQRGTINAETLPAFTHYDYEAPSADLEATLVTEADRLSSLDITSALIAQEAPRIYSEISAVEANPLGPIAKHAMMAANQSWRFGTAHALVRGGLDAIKLDDLRAFTRSAYAPNRLTLALVGDFDVMRAEALVRQHLGGLAKSDRFPSAPVDWSKVPAQRTMTWDATLSCVVLAWEPPNDLVERLVLSALGDLASQRLFESPTLEGLVGMTLTTNSSWACGRLPYLAYATVAAGKEPGEVAAKLADRILEIVGTDLDESTHMMLGHGLRLAADPQPVTKETIDQTANMVAGIPAFASKSKEERVGIAQLHYALQEALRQHRLRGLTPADLERARAMKPEQLTALVQSTITRGKMKSLVITPGK